MPETTHQPSIELDNEKIVINHADGSRTTVTVGALAEKGDDHGLLLFGQLVVAQAQAARLGELANAVGALSQAIGQLGASQAAVNPEALIGLAMEQVKELMAAQPGGPANGGAA